MLAVPQGPPTLNLVFSSPPARAIFPAFSWSAPVSVSLCVVYWVRELTLDSLTGSLEAKTHRLVVAEASLAGRLLLGGSGKPAM